jgi:hypothetical protein
MKHRTFLGALLLVFATSIIRGGAQTAPPAPMLVQPANGASLVQPMTLAWSAVVDPDGPIANYTWQVGTTSTFSTIIASGFTDVRNGDPIPTQARLSGLPNGTYFWRVRTTQTVGGAVGFIDSAWSASRSFTITGLGAAPGAPSFTGPGNGSRFHPYETFKITWTPVTSAQYYVLEADDEPSFSYPFTLSLSPMEFSSFFGAGWGNEIPNIYYRVRAVSADHVRGLPSAALNVKILNAAPVPPRRRRLSRERSDRLAAVHVRLVGHREPADSRLRNRRRRRADVQRHVRRIARAEHQPIRLHPGVGSRAGHVLLASPCAAWTDVRSVVCGHAVPRRRVATEPAGSQSVLVPRPAEQRLRRPLDSGPRVAECACASRRRVGPYRERPAARRGAAERRHPRRKTDAIVSRSRPIPVPGA